jgi:hypothetical protein
MHRKKLVTLVCLGIAMGTLYAQGDKGQMPPEMQKFYEQLEPEAQQKFLDLDKEHKEAAMDIMKEMACKAEHECKGHREHAVEEQYNLQMQQRNQANEGMKSAS